MITLIKRKPGVALLISDIIDFRANHIPGGKEVHLVMIKGSIHQKGIIIPNIYASTNKALKYVKQKLINFQGETDKSTTTIRDLMAPSQYLNRKSRQEISKDIGDLKT